MKTTRKFLSVLLSILMIVSMVSVSFTAFAAQIGESSRPSVFIISATDGTQALSNAGSVNVTDSTFQIKLTNIMNSNSRFSYTVSVNGDEVASFKSSKNGATEKTISGSFDVGAGATVSVYELNTNNDNDFSFSGNVKPNGTLVAEPTMSYTNFASSGSITENGTFNVVGTSTELSVVNNESGATLSATYGGTAITPEVSGSTHKYSLTGISGTAKDFVLTLEKSGLITRSYKLSFVQASLAAPTLKYRQSGTSSYSNLTKNQTSLAYKTLDLQVSNTNSATVTVTYGGNAVAPTSSSGGTYTYEIALQSSSKALKVTLSKDGYQDSVTSYNLAYQAIGSTSVKIGSTTINDGDTYTADDVSAALTVALGNRNVKAYLYCDGGSTAIASKTSTSSGQTSFNATLDTTADHTYRLLLQRSDYADLEYNFTVKAPAGVPDISYSNADGDGVIASNGTYYTIGTSTVVTVKDNANGTVSAKLDGAALNYTSKNDNVYTYALSGLADGKTFEWTVTANGTSLTRTLTFEQATVPAVVKYDSTDFTTSAGNTQLTKASTTVSVTGLNGATCSLWVDGVLKTPTSSDSSSASYVIALSATAQLVRVLVEKENYKSIDVSRSFVQQSVNMPTIKVNDTSVSNGGTVSIEDTSLSLNISTGNKNCSYEVYVNDVLSTSGTGNSATKTIGGLTNGAVIKVVNSRSGYASQTFTFTVSVPKTEDMSSSYYTKSGGFPFEKTTDGGAIWKSSNQGIDNSHSDLYLDISKCGILKIQYKLSSEANYDKAKFLLDGNELTDLTASGGADGDTAAGLEWKTVTINITEKGNHTLNIQYAKDGSQSRYLDTMYLGSAVMLLPSGNMTLDYDSKYGTVDVNGVQKATGSITAFDAGESITLKLNTNEGMLCDSRVDPSRKVSYEFKGWADAAGTVLSTNNPASVLLTGSGTVHPIIEESCLLPETMTFTSSTGNKTDLLAGDFITIFHDMTTDASTSYTFNHSTLNGVTVSATVDGKNQTISSRSFTISNITADKTVVITVKANGCVNVVKTVKFICTRDPQTLVKEGSEYIEVNPKPFDDFGWKSSDTFTENGIVAFEPENYGRLDPDTVNQNRNTSANMAVKVFGQGVFSFEVKLNNEFNDSNGNGIGDTGDTLYDGIAVSIGGAPIPESTTDCRPTISGRHLTDSWRQYVFNVDAPSTGMIIYIGYAKDSSDGSNLDGTEVAAIRNICFLKGADDLTVNVDGSTYGTVTGVATATAGSVNFGTGVTEINIGSNITLTAQPTAEGQFYGWYDEAGTLVSTSLTYSFAFGSARTVKALFASKGYYTTKVGSNYYTSLEAANTAAVSGQTIILLNKNNSITSDFTLKKGVTLVLPCMDNDPGYTKEGFNPDGTTSNNNCTQDLSVLYSTFTIPAGVTFTVNGTLLVNGVTARYVAGSDTFYNITGGYAKVALSGNIVVNNGGTLDVSGRIEGSGQVTLNSGAKMYETYSIKRWRGGTYSYNMLGKIYPIYESEMNACRATLRINSGASLQGTVKAYSGGMYCSRYPQIDNSSGIYRLPNSSAYIIRTVEWDANLRESYSNSLGTYRDVYKFYGGATLDAGVLKIVGTDISTDSAGYFEVDGDMRFEFYDGTYTVNKKFEFMPGFELVLGDKANVTVNANGGLLFVEQNFYPCDARYTTGSHYPQRANAKLSALSGSSLTVKSGAAIAGEDITFGSGSTVNVKSAAKTITTKVAIDAYTSGNTVDYTVGLKINGYAYSEGGITPTQEEGDGYQSITWFDSTNVEEGLPGYVQYNGKWTAEKADKLAQNIDNIYSQVAKMTGLDLKAKVNGLIYDSKNIAMIYNALASLGDNVGEGIGEIIENTGVSLSSWDDLSTFGLAYNEETDVWSYNGTAFTEGDKATFIEILGKLLKPLDPLLGFILTGKTTDIAGGALTLNGFEAYNDTLKLLTDAFGIDPISDFKGTYLNNPSDGITAIIGQIADKLDLMLDTPSIILDLLPNLAYFLESEGISVVLNNFVYPLKVLARNIDPTYTSVAVEGRINNLLNKIVAGALPEGASVTLTIDDKFDNLVYAAVDTLLDAKFGVAVADILVPALKLFCLKKNVTGTGTVTMDKGDELTALMSMLFEILEMGDNAARADAALGTNGLLTALKGIFNVPEATMAEINWSYCFDKEHTLPYLVYDNDWSRPMAQYTDAQLDAIVDSILDVVGNDALTLILNQLNIFNNDTVKLVIGALKTALGKFDPDIVGLLGDLIDCDLSALLDYDEESINVTDTASFIDAVEDILEPAAPVLAYMLLGESFNYFTGSGIIEETVAGASIVNFNGAEGYRFGLVPLLEALGCEVKSASAYYTEKGEALPMVLLDDVLKSLCARVDSLLKADNPIDEILNILPNLIYFINANGLTVSVNNVLASLVDMVDVLGTITGQTFDVNEMIGYNIDDLSFSYIISLASDMLGDLDLSKAAAVLEGMFFGEVSSYTSSNGMTAYKMSYSDAESRADMITIMCGLLLDVVKTDGNAEKLDKFLDMDGIVEKLLTVIDGVEAENESINWAYETVAPSYIAYNNDWTKEKAKLLDENIDKVITGLIQLVDPSAESITDFLGSFEIYTDETVNKIAELLKTAFTDLNGTVKEQIGSETAELVYKMLGLKAEDILAYEANTVYGVKDKETFISAVKTVIAPFSKVLSYLLLKDDYGFFASDSVIISGGEGYKYGIIPVLEALGITADAEYASINALLEGVLTKLCAFIDGVLADPVNTLVDLLPNLVYFVNADGLKACLNNLIAPLTALLDAIGEATGKSFDLSVITDTTDKLDLSYIFELLDDNTGIDFTETMKDDISKLLIGEKQEFTSANGLKAYKATADREDTLTVLLSIALEAFRYNPNAAQALDTLLGTDGLFVSIAEAKLIEGLDISCEDINWNYETAAPSYIAYNNNWTKEKAKSLDSHLDEIITSALSFIDPEATSISDITDAITVYSDENVNTIASLLKNVALEAVAVLKGQLGENGTKLLLDMLDIDLLTLAEYEDGTVYDVEDAESFINAIITIVDPIDRALSFLLLGDGYEFFADSEKKTLVKVNGGEGYKYGIIPVLEALGITADAEYANTDALLEGVLTKLCAFIDGVLADPVNTLVDLLPNLVYFVNADGLKACMSNLIAPLTALLDAIEEATGKKIDISMITDIIEKLDLSYVFELLDEKTGIDFTETMKDDISKLLIGEKQEFTSANGLKAYKATADREDTLTVLISIVLEAVKYNPDAAQALDTLLGTDGLFVSIVEEKLLEGIEPVYDEDINTEYYKSVDNSLEYLKYSNDWTRKAAEYIDNNLDDITALLLEKAGIDLDLTKTFNIYTDDTVSTVAMLLQAVVGKLTEMTNETVLAALGKLIDCDLTTVFAYSKDTTYGVTGEESFKAAVAEILEPVEALIDFMLLGKDYKFFTSSNDLEDMITVKGAEGYEKGLKPILTVLGCEAGDYENAHDLVAGVLDGVCEALDAILSDPVNEALNLLPELISFVNSGALRAAINNTVSAAVTLAEAVSGIAGFSLDLSSVSEAAKSVKLSKILSLLAEKTGIDIPEGLGTFFDTYYFDTEAYDRADLITVILSVALEILTYGDNVKTVDSLLGTDVLEKLLPAIFDSKAAEMKDIDWLYTEGFETVKQSTEYLTYPNNWNKATAEYVDANITDILNGVIKAYKPDLGGISGLLGGLTDKLYTDAVVNEIAMLLKKAVSVLDSDLADILGNVLDCDLNAVLAYTDTDTYGVKDKTTFINAVINVLSPVKKLLALTLLDRDYTLFVYSGKVSGTKGDDIFTLNGAEGYKYGIVPLLEAIGCKAESGYGDIDTLLNDVLGKLLTRLDGIIKSPVEEILDILPNLIYFTNAGGLTAAVNNSLTGLVTLVNEVGGIVGKTIDLDEMTGLQISDISLKYIFSLLENMTGLKLEKIEKFFELFYLGKLESFVSANGENVFRMVYTDEIDRSDMLTILASVVLELVKNEDNASALKSLLGDKAYEVVNNLIRTKMFPMAEINWMNVEYADTDKVFSGVETSELFSDGYGSFFGKKEAQYISDNLDEFVSTFIELAGIEVSGEYMHSAKELLAGLVGTTVYSVSMANRIYGYVKQVLDKVNSLPGSEHIKQVIKKSLGVDLHYYDTFTVGTFEDGDRAAFTEAITGMVRPLFPVLDWLLCEKELSFFVDENGKDAVIFKGAQGYNYGIIPVLEALFCENVKTQAQYYADIAEDRDNMIADIIEPLFDRLDVILANPVDELFAILPNIAYFINSDGLDTCFKNIMNPVLALLDSLEPLTGEIDIYDILGINLRDVTFSSLLKAILSKVTDKTGFELEPMLLNATVEFTTGKVVSYTSANGDKAYRMEYAGESDKADQVTIITRTVLSFLAVEENAKAIEALIKENLPMSEDSYELVCTMIELAAVYSSTELGTETMMYALYTIFKGVQTGLIEVDSAKTTANKKLKSIYNTLSKNSNGIVAVLAKTLLSVANNYFGDIISEEGIAPHGIIPFITSIVNMFRRIFEFFKSIFK